MYGRDFLRLGFVVKMASQRDVDGCSFSVPLILPVLHRRPASRPSFPSCCGIILRNSAGPAANVAIINNDNSNISSSYSAVGTPTVSTAAAVAVAVAGGSFAFREGALVRCC